MQSKEPLRISEWATALHKLARPYLTVLIATLYNITLLVAVSLGVLPIRDYILAIGPTNAMIIGFWFGERAALKKPDGKGSEE